MPSIKKPTPARFVMIRDKSLIELLHAVRRDRNQEALSRTAADLLRERLSELRTGGDPLAIRQDGRRVSKAG